MCSFFFFFFFFFFWTFVVGFEMVVMKERRESGSLEEFGYLALQATP